jgi:3-oxoacyl-[acyl-carrier-protein] synthase-1
MPGLCCCAGKSKEELFTSSISGDQSGIKPVINGENKHFMTGLVSGLSAQGDNRLFEITKAALEQIRGEVEAVVKKYGPKRVGVCAGSCDNGSETSFPAHKSYFSGNGFPPSYNLSLQSAFSITEYIASFFGIEGPCFTVAAACASGAEAVVKGAEFIESGICDAVIAGGADIVSQTVLLGFSALEAVSDEICNPFSKNRKGITLGEGAAFFVMHKDKTQTPSVRLLGWGESADAYHMTAPRPDGAGAFAAMRDAITMSGLSPKDIDYINLHGTGTPLNDSMESAAIHSLFADNKPPVSSTKPVTGHALGAAGALELALCWMALVNGGLPAHCWDGEYDDSMPRLLFVSPGNTELPKICMSNSFAFGGCNTSLVIARKDA